MIKGKAKQKNFRLVNKKELPFYCPPKEEENWNMHPKVFLVFDAQGKASCYYCSSKYEIE